MTATSPTPTSITVQRLALRVWDHAGAGPRVLFVHGFLDTGRSWDTVAQHLGDDVRALAIDLRGHGESEQLGNGGSLHLIDHIKDLSLVLRALAERGEAIDALVAHSMGGNVALILAGALPELVPRLLLLDALGPPAEDPEDQPARLERLLRSLDNDRPMSSFATLDDALDRLQSYNAGLTREGARRMAEPVLRPDPDDGGRLRFPFDLRLRGPTPVRHPEPMWQALCARVTCPVRVVRAANGYIPEGEPVPARLAAMRDARLTTWPDTGHHLHVDEPKRVADEVRALLREPTAADVD